MGDISIKQGSSLMKIGPLWKKVLISKYICIAAFYNLKKISILGHPSTPTQGAWLAKTLPQGSKVGVDPRLLSKEQWAPLSKMLVSAGHSLVPVNRNLIDVLWENKPPPPNHVITPLDIAFAGNFSFYQYPLIWIVLELWNVLVFGDLLLSRSYWFSIELMNIFLID